MCWFFPNWVHQGVTPEGRQWKMLKSQRKGLILLVFLWADLGMASTEVRPMVRYRWNDLNHEKQGIFTGSVNNHSILAFKIEDHYLKTCGYHHSGTICHRKRYHVRTEEPLHESRLPSFNTLCEISPRMTFNQLPSETRSQLLNSSEYMVMWNLKVPTRSCLVLHIHVNSSDSSLTNGAGNRLYLEDSEGRHDIVKGDAFDYPVQNWSRTTQKMVKVVYVQKAYNETIDFHFTAQKTLVYHCECAQYHKRALPDGA